jgi:hypothetical protein
MSNPEFIGKGWGMKVLAIVPAEKVPGLPDYAVKVVYEGNDYCPEGCYEYIAKDDVVARGITVDGYANHYHAESYIDFLRNASHEDLLNVLVHYELQKKIASERKENILAYIRISPNTLSEVESHINGDIALTLKILEMSGKIHCDSSGRWCING